MEPVKMNYCPTKDTGDFVPGDWKWLHHDSDAKDGESMRVGIMYMLPNGDLAAALERGDHNNGHHGARWTITGDETTGLTVEPSIMHKRGKEGEWHGYIRNGQLETLPY